MNSRLLCVLLSFSSTVFASPWWTGPLLAPSGRTIPAGHVNFEPYGFYTVYPQHYRNYELLPILTVGLTNFIDLQTSLPVDYDTDQGQHSGGIGDYSLGLGFQILREDENTWLPYLRMTIQEIFPTGKYQNLNPTKLGTDQTGNGTFQTSINFIFQKTKQFKKEHYLRTRLALAGGYAQDVTVRGFNAYGGGAGAVGKVAPGNNYSADLAFEYSLTQHWVPVFEMLYANSKATGFSGNPGLSASGAVGGVGGGGGSQISLAPAIEYNFNGNIGIIGGVWFSVTGKPSSQFTAYTIALNYYF